MNLDSDLPKQAASVSQANDWLSVALPTPVEGPLLDDRGSMLDHALAYAARGWRVFPVHSFDASGSCTCEDGPGCKPGNQGKHPRLRGWQTVATTDPGMVTNWWSMWPDANIGLCTGGGLLVLDVDVKEYRDKQGRSVKKQGETSLAALEAQHGPLPRTLTVQTPSLGWHLYLSYPSELHLKRSLSKLGDGLDVMAEGSYVVAPPSVHVNGRRSSYAFVADGEFAPAPGWLVAHATTPPALPVRERGDDKDYPPATLVTLEAAREALRRHGPAIEGQAGDHHTYRAAAILANDFALSPEEAWPLFLEWNTTCVPPWAEDDLHRKLWGGEKYAKGERGEARDAIIVESALRSAALARPGPASARASSPPSTDGRYTTEDIARFADRQGCAPPEWRKRWIVQCGSSFWIWVNGRYATPVPSTSAFGTAEQFLAPAGLEFQKPTKGDGYRKKTMAEVMEDYGSFAFRVEAYLDLQETFYDPVAGVLHEAVCPIRDDLRPEFSPLVDRWLRLLGGSMQEVLLDWVATLTVLGKPTCALYLCAEGGIGKQLFADGLARIWSLGGPSSLRHVLGNFNETLTRCPLVLADEKLPKLPGQSGISGELRTIIAESSRTLNRKNIAHANLGGCIRLVIAANNEHVLEDKSERDLTQADIDAIAARYLFVDARPQSAEIRAFLESIGGRAGTEAWVAGDAIARHALWLRDNRPVAPGKRFLVEGRLTAMHEAVAWAYGIAGDLLLWICRFVENPMKIQQQAGSGVLCGNGVVLVTAATVAEFWCHYLKREQVSEALIGRQLRNISKRKSRPTICGRRRSYYEINLEILLAFAEREVDADLEDLKRRINTVDPSWVKE